MVSKEYEKQLVEAVLGYLNEINKPKEEDRDKREIKGKHAYIDGVNAEKIVKKFVEEMSEIDAFNFFPFEAIDPSIAAIFCGNHLLQRGSVFNNLLDKSENEDESSSTKKLDNGYREIMNNLKNEKYYNLRKDGLIDTFIIKKEELDDIFKNKYAANIPDYPDEFLTKKGNDLIRRVVSSMEFDCNDNITNQRYILSCFKVILKAFLIMSTFYAPLQ